MDVIDLAHITSATTALVGGKAVGLRGTGTDDHRPRARLLDLSGLPARPTGTPPADRPATPAEPVRVDHRHRRAVTLVPHGTGRLTCRSADRIIGCERATGRPMALPVRHLPPAPGHQRGIPWT